MMRVAAIVSRLMSIGSDVVVDRVERAPEVSVACSCAE